LKAVVNFIYILRVNFSYESDSGSFSLVTFWHSNYVKISCSLKHFCTKNSRLKCWWNLHLIYYKLIDKISTEASHMTKLWKLSFEVFFHLHHFVSLSLSYYPKHTNIDPLRHTQIRYNTDTHKHLSLSLSIYLSIYLSISLYLYLSLSHRHNKHSHTLTHTHSHTHSYTHSHTHSHTHSQTHSHTHEFAVVEYSSEIQYTFTYPYFVRRHSSECENTFFDIFQASS